MATKPAHSFQSPTHGHHAINRATARWILFTALLLCAGCTSTNSSSPLTGGERIESNTLTAGDVVSVTFPTAAELNQAQKIRLDGKISLPILGEVVAAGKSPKTLQEELKTQYAGNLQDSKVVVSLVTSVNVVYVNGEVRGPGKVVLDRQMTVFEVIMESGGFSPIANPKKVTLTRQQNGKLERYLLNLGDGSDSAGTYVKPFDTITVGQSWF